MNRARRAHKAALAVFFALAAAPGGARADGDVGPRDMMFEAGFGGGVFIVDDEHEFYDHTIATQRPLRNANGVGMIRFAFFPLAFLGVEAEGGRVYTKVDGGGKASLPFWRFSLVGQLPMRLSPFVFAGAGNMWIESEDDVLGDDRDRVFHAGVGVKYWLKRWLHLRLDGRWHYTNRLRDGADENGMVSHWETTIGLGFNFGGASVARMTSVVQVTVNDNDGDGFTTDDRCPEDPGVAPDGCPARDLDNDGMVEPQDMCPTEAETVNQHEDQDGCPDQLPDNDGDGLRGDVDRCPDQPEDIDSFEDEDGCPETDNDKDGALDASDGCPIEVGPMENRGCPDTDRDSDTVVDRLDNCPDEAGTAANQGCKKKQLVVLTQTQLKILDKVYFATNKAQVLPRSRKLLDNIASVLEAHPEIKKLRIEGHTDDVGDDLKNKELSQKRADSVREYLIGKRIATDRLEAVGFGEEKPLEDNATKKGKAANRRVEFNIVDPGPVLDSAATGTEVTPPPGTETPTPTPAPPPPGTETKPDVKPTEGAGPPPP